MNEEPPITTNSQQVDASGNNNQQYFSQYGNVNVTQEKPEFFEPNLERVESPDYINPQIQSGLFTSLEQQGLLILGDNSGININEFSLYLASQIKKQNHLHKIDIKQWRKSSDPQSIDIALQKTEQNTVFILTDITPQNIDYDLERLRKATNKIHYIILTTELPKESWKLSDSCQQLFFDISIEGLYRSKDLEIYIIRQLNKLKRENNLPPVLRKQDSINLNKTLIAKLSLREIAQELKTPDYIDRFIQFIQQEKQHISPERLEELINLAKGKKDAIEQWYHHSLNSREQLLALGLSFFDGLFEEQIFAGLEKIVELAWQKRDPSLRALDYCDLDNLLNFFKFDDSRVISNISQQRLLLLKVAWNSHRRQIISALSVMEWLVQNSVAGRNNNRELFGDSSRRKLLRIAISETISDLGSISIAVVEDTLLQLSADNDMGVQIVAAYAMARWRESRYKMDRQLFDLLEDWLDLTTAKRLIDFMKSVLENETKNQTSNITKPEDYIRSTVALTISYAALYDPPSQLSKPLLELLKKLSKDYSPLVRNRFLYHTLPMVTRLHIEQLSNFIYELHQCPNRDLKYNYLETVRLNKAVGISLADAYLVYGNIVLDILNSWTQKTLATDKNTTINKFLKSHYHIKIDFRDVLISSVARAYGEMRYEINNGLTIKEIFAKLHQLIKEEKHPFTRQAILEAVGDRIRDDFRLIEPQLQNFLRELNQDEIQNILNIISQIYFEQRIELKGGDYWADIQRNRRWYSYQIWINNPRPLTEIEIIINNWIKISGNSAVNQIALQAKINFAQIIDKQEALELEKITNKPQDDENTSSVDDSDVEKDRPGFYINQVVPFLTICLKLSLYFLFKIRYFKEVKHNFQYYKNIISALLPEAIKQKSSRESTVDFVLKRFSDENDKKIKVIADLLSFALKIAR